MKHHGFPKDERVRRTEEFTDILQRGSRIRGSLLSAFWIPVSRDSGPGAVAANRVGLAAGKRLGNAVVRNRLKRRMREAYRRNKRELPCRGVSIVFVASPRMIGRTAREVEEDLTKVLGIIAHSSS